MKILVCIKQVPESNKVQVDEVTGVLKRNSSESKMNPYDLYALETALRLKEKYGGSVDVITMGPPQAKSILYEAFAMSADEGAIITDRKFGGADVLATSYTLSQGIKSFGDFDLIICGLQTTDGDTAQVGPEVSEMLKIPCVCNVNKIIDVKDKSIIVDMDMSDDIERIEINYPCLITVQKDIVEPRLPSYLRKKATEHKQVKVFTLNDMVDKDEHHYGLNASPTKVQKIFPPSSDKVQEKISGNIEEITDTIYQKLKSKKIVF